MTDVQTPPLEAPPVSAGRASTGKWRVPVLTGAAGLVIGLLIGSLIPIAVGAAEEQAQAEAEAAVAAQVDETFSNAVRACGADKTYAIVGDKGNTLSVEHAGKDDFGAGITGEEVWCLIDSMDAPQAVVSHMEQTTSMDGRQTETWDNIEASWSYHPDRGMDSVFKITD